MYLDPKHDTLLAAAARTTRDRIAADEERASAGLKPLLRHFKEHLFDAELRIGRWLAACEEQDRLLSLRFKDEIGQAPLEYLWDCRLEVAARLLRDTELSITTIAELVGYAGRTAFSGSFWYWWGLRPLVFREKVRQTESALGATPEILFSTPFLCDAMSGRLPLEQVKVLYDRLQAVNRATLAPQSSAGPDELQGDASRDAEYEQILAEQIWEALRHRPFGEQLQLVPRQLGFETAALFDLLQKKSLEEGRTNRQRGVELAELALSSLECCPRGCDLDLQIRARILLGNARRIALDYPGAEREFFIAETEWAQRVDHRDRSVEADLLHGMAGLRWFQRRYPEALHLVNQALAIYRAMASPFHLARSLMMRVGIRQESGDLRPTIPDIEEALTLLRGRNEPYLEAAASSQLAKSHIQRGDFAAARDALRMAVRFHRGFKDPLGRLQLRWLAALVRQGEGAFDKAERLFRRTHEKLLALGERGHAAAISLDLAILYARQRRTQQALDLAAPAIAILKEFDIDPAAFTALDRLTSALATRAVNLPALQKARAVLDQIVRDARARETAALEGAR